MSRVPIPCPPVQRDGPPCTLSLTIGLESYAVRGMPPGRPGGELRYLLTDADGGRFTVVAFADLCACDCDAFAGSDRPCRHVQALRQVGLLPAPTPEPDDPAGVEVLDLGALLTEAARPLRRAV